GEVTSQIGVTRVRRAAFEEPKIYSQDDEAAAFAAVENAAAITKAACFITQFANLVVAFVQNLKRVDGLGDFLASSTARLYWSSAQAAGNAAETLDSRVVLADRRGDESVPRFAGPDLKNFCSQASLDAADSDSQN